MAEVDSAASATVLPTMDEQSSTALSRLPESTKDSSDRSAAPPSESVKKTRIVRRKRRPARPQVDPATTKSEPPPQTGTIFNIWYNKWAGGDREDSYLSQTHAQGRCNVAADSGYTRADQMPGSYFCLFFARGLCPRGHECEYLHRLPGLHDHFNPNVDCFGRDKHSDYRDDMGGVGSFLRQNRTLYVGRIHVTDDIEEVVARHFAEWGDVERTRVLTGRGVAFITYANETNAQFAKEAMAHQSLDHDEILNVRWATMDPNPAAQKREEQRIEEQAAEAIRRALPAEFVQEIEGRMPESRKRRREEDGFQLDGYDVPDAIWYAQPRPAKDSLAAAIEAAPVSGAGVNKTMGEDPARQAEAMGKATNMLGEASNSDISLPSGILSNSTLAAVRQYTGQQQIMRPTQRKWSPTRHALVGYSSESESDD